MGPAQVSLTWNLQRGPIQSNSSDILSLSTFPSPNHLLCVSLVCISPTSLRMLGGEVGYPANGEPTFPTESLSGPNSIVSDLGRRSGDVMTENSITGIWRAGPGGPVETREWNGGGESKEAVKFF